MNLLIILTESCILFKQDASVDFVNINNNTTVKIVFDYQSLSPEAS